MNLNPEPLFNKTVIEKLCSKIKLTDLQKQSALEWIKKIENNEVNKEQEGQNDFETIVLQEILGYNGRDCKREKLDIDYTINLPGFSKNLCIEVKGTDTKDLFKTQNRQDKSKENPVIQLYTYMGHGYDYGVVSNYVDFILLTQNTQLVKAHKFDFLSIKKTEDRIDENKLKEFILLFSKKEVFVNNSIEELSNQTILSEQEFTDEFYKLFHETRLMLIKEFEESCNMPHDLSIHYSQIFLNRLIFIFFVEDNNFIPNSIFEKRILGILKSPSIDESTHLIYDDIIGLFKIMNVGSNVQGINGFNGGLFGDEIPSNLTFSDLHKTTFFTECYQNSSLELKTATIDIAISGIYAETLSPLIKNLLIMASYNFTSDLNVNILGHIFEQSISDIELLKENEISKRKKDGVYYTPDYITDFICRNTIVPYLSKTNKTSVFELVDEYSENLEELETKLKNLKILDPACGSGAFLVKSVEVLHEIDNEIQYRKPVTSETKKPMDEYLKIKEINLIIENNIYGVDLNPASVEITKLSLFLKLAGPQSKLGYLSNNIKSGNSLIYDKTITKNAFSWEDEFPEILGSLIPKKGFDIIIGNPPYIRQELFKKIKPELSKKYNSYHSSADMYVYFIEKGITLLKLDGLVSFIVPNKFMKTVYGENLRKFLVNSIQLELIYNFDDYPVFDDATTYTMIMTIKKQKKDKSSFIYSELNDKKTKNPFDEFKQNEIQFQQSKLSLDPWLVAKPEIINLIEKLSNNANSLKKFTDNKIYRGISTGRNDVFIIDEVTQKLLKNDSTSTKIIKKVVTGNEVKRYKIDFQGMYILFIPWNYDLEYSKSIKTYLTDNKDTLSARPEVKQGRFNWWALSRYGSTSSHLLSQTKIIYPRISNRCNFCLDESKEMYLTDNNFFISSDSKSLLALLNSKLIFFFMKNHCPSLQGGYYDFRRPYVEKIPIHESLHDYEEKLSKNVSIILEKILEYEDEEKYFWDVVVSSFKPSEIDQSIKSNLKIDFDLFINKLNKNSKNPLYSRQTPDEYIRWKKIFDKTQKSLEKISSEIIELEDKIDIIIFKIYGLNEDEIKIIENNVSEEILKT